MGGGTWSPPISRKSHLEDKILQPDSCLTIGNFRPLSCISCRTDNLTETENPKQELWSRLKRITALREMLQTCTLNTGPDGTGTVRWSQNQKKSRANHWTRWNRFRDAQQRYPPTPAINRGRASEQRQTVHGQAANTYMYMYICIYVCMDVYVKR